MNQRAAFPGSSRNRGHVAGKSGLQGMSRREDRSGRGRGNMKSRPSDPGASDNPQEFNADLQERFGRTRGVAAQSRRLMFDKIQQAEAEGFDLSLNHKIREYVTEQDRIIGSPQSEAWLQTHEIATSDEISLLTGDPVTLPANRIKKPYKSTAKYLKTHYSLLREDAVGNLREAIDKFRLQPGMVDDHDVNIYEKVHITGFTFTSHGIAARIKFSMARAGKRIMWSASKRLVSGTMVALSVPDDDFKSKCIVAIIAARPLQLLDKSPPEVDIYFGRSQDIEIDPQKEFIMVEAKSGYYEAQRHTLKALQKLSAEPFPLADIIMAKSLEIDPPQYLANYPQRNLSAAYSSETASGATEVDILDAWPGHPAGHATTLDDTQWDALKHILTKRLAIIQGPPGTGKTHVSKIALKVMVENKSSNDPPIIIAAQTNHALDQLLEQVSEFEPEYIRLGGRSTSAEVKKRALFNIVQNERIPQIPGSSYHSAKNRMRDLHAKFGLILSLLDESSEPMSAETLLRLGILTLKQKNSLDDAVKNWVTADSNTLSPMQHWLHNSLVPFEVHYSDDTFGFEELEEDLEMEQIRETEAEHGINDEEDIEMLTGPWRAVHDHWHVPDLSDRDVQRAKLLLDTKEDLWQDVPEKLRGPMYSVMQQKAKTLAMSRFRELAVEYDAVIKDIKICKWEKDAVFLKRANVIGLTTTGLSKYRALISSLEPKIILIEEAAEVIEAPITVACMPSLQHLILVGDHKQLQGHCAVKDLEGPDYNLHVSMFERLANMNIPFKTLLKQRRMNPEFRALISSLYPQLEDHSSVLNRSNSEDWGTGQIRSFFFNHAWLEAKDDSMSTYNEEEARIVVKFYRHLRHNCIPPGGITILTFYNGQRKRILRELRNDPVTNVSYNNVKTVDSYQGEESGIVILSLARSNVEGKIGFLEIENRVCVALSRAKFGFYIFGNADLVAERSPLWANVVGQMKSSRPRRFGNKFPIQCKNHSRTMHLQYPEEWDELDGGCDQPCGGRFDCGHPCLASCHAYPHATMLCTHLCDRVQVCGQMCQKLCHEQCNCTCADCEKATAASAYANAFSDIPTARTVQGLPNKARLGPAKQTQPVSRPSTASSRGRNSNGHGTQLARGGGAFQNQPHVYTEGFSQFSDNHLFGDQPLMNRGHSHGFSEQSLHQDGGAAWASFASAHDQRVHPQTQQPAQLAHTSGSPGKNKNNISETQRELLDILAPQHYKAMAAAVAPRAATETRQVNYGETSRSAGGGRHRHVQDYVPTQHHQSESRQAPTHSHDSLPADRDMTTVKKIMEEVNLLD